MFGWLAGVGLDVTCLTKPGYEVPVAAYSALLEQAIELTGDSGLGLRLGCNLVPSAHGNVGLAALSANTIQESMQIVERYVPLRTSLLAIRSETVNDEFRVVFEPIPGLGEIGNVVAEIALGTVKNIIDATVASNSPCQSILFSMSEPSHAALSRELLGCEVLLRAIVDRHLPQLFGSIKPAESSRCAGYVRSAINLSARPGAP